MRSSEPPFTYLAAVNQWLVGEGAADEGAFPLRVRILGSLQRVVSAIKYQDEDEQPLPGFSLDVFIEDGSFMCQAVVGHDPLYNALGTLLSRFVSCIGEHSNWSCF